MAKNPKHQRLDSIPLPETVRDALSRPSRDVPYVSREVRIGEKPENPELTGANHAFYFGKLFPETMGDRTFKVLGWEKGEKRIYTPEVVAGALDYSFRHLKQGEKAQVLIGPSLSELFNGPEDVEGALTSDQEKELIARIAKKKFKKEKGNLEIRDMEELPEHRDLFQALRRSVNSETKVVDPAKAFGSAEPKIEPGCSSLEIAKCLYQAAQKSEPLMHAFLHAVPSRLKGAEVGRPAIAYYALAEVAIRLSDILRGRTIQGGVGRQDEYDGLIAKLMRGREGKSFRGVAELNPLFDLLKGHRFETLHLDTEENFYRRNIAKIRARLRLLLIGALGLGAITGAKEYGRQVERKERQKYEARLDERVDKELDSTRFFIDRKFMLERTENTRVFRVMLRSMKYELGVRYQISDGLQDEVEPLLAQYLIDHKSDLMTIHNNYFLIQDAVDQFVQANSLYFAQKGLQSSEPYARFKPHLELFREAAISEDEAEIPLDEVERGKWPINPLVKERSIESLGKFVGWGPLHYSFPQEFDLAVVRGMNGDGKLMARITKWENGENREFLSAKEGREAAKEVLNSFRRYDAMPLMRFKDVILKYYPLDPASRLAPKSVREEAEAPHFKHSGEPIVAYRDSLGEFEYEVALWHDFDESTKSSTPMILARHPGGVYFTSELGKEAMDHFISAAYPWFLEKE